MQNRINNVGVTDQGVVGAYRPFNLLNTWLVAVALVALFTVAGASTAAADVITTFNVSGTFGNGASFVAGSTITINTTLGAATDSNLTISAGSNSPVNVFTGVPNTDNGSFMTPFIWDLADGTDLMIYPLAGTSYQGFTGGPVCCVFYSNPPVWGFSNGSFDTVLTPTQVPEPADISLLGIGLAGVMEMVRRRGSRRSEKN